MSEIEENTEVLDELENEVSKSSKKPLTSQPLFIYGSLGAIFIVFAVFMYVALGSGNDLPKKKAGWGKAVANSESESPKETSKEVAQSEPAQSKPKAVEIESQVSANLPHPSEASAKEHKEPSHGQADTAAEKHQPEAALVANKQRQSSVSANAVRDLKTHVDSLQRSNMVVHNDIKEQLKAINERLEGLASTNQSTSNGEPTQESSAKRLPGFSVISFTNDGKYAVIKAPTSVITLFKGEKFSSHLGRHHVLGMYQKDGRIEVSKGYFIDGKRIEAPKSTSRPKVKTVVAKEKSRDSQEGSARPPESHSAFGKDEIEGYNVMAVVEQGNAVILQDRTGSVFRLNLGDKLDGFGSVKHITDEGNVLFINHIIRKI